jgi:hypothetical protein
MSQDQSVRVTMAQLSFRPLARLLAVAIGLSSGSAPAEDLSFTLPALGLRSVGRSIDSETSIRVELVGREQPVYLPPEIDAHLWKEHRGTQGNWRRLVLRDNRHSQGLMRFDVDALRGQGTVRRATFRFRLETVERGDRPGKILLHRLLTDWSENASWYKPALDRDAEWNGLRAGTHFVQEPFAVVEKASMSVGSLVEMEVTEALQAWLRGDWPNHGFLFLYQGAGIEIGVPSREAAQAPQVLELGGENHGMALLQPDLPLFRRLLLRPDDLVSAKAQVTVPGAGDLAAGVLSLHRALTPSDPYRRPVPGVDYEAQSLGTLVPVSGNSEGRMECEVGAVLRDWVRGDAPAHGLLILARDGITAQVAGSGDGKRMPTFAVTTRRNENARLFDDPVRIQPGVYTTVKDGHLHYGGQRLRLWGTLGRGSAERLKKMGFNAWRNWGTNPDKLYTARSIRTGSFDTDDPAVRDALDGFNRRIAALKAANIFIMVTQTIQNMPMDLLVREDSFVSGGEDWEQWKAAVKADPRGASRFVFFDERLEKARRAHLSNILNLHNPYTGRRMAEEEANAIYELNNENEFPKHVLEGNYEKWPEYFQEKLRSRWNAWLLRRYGNDTALRAAWKTVPAAESLAQGSIRLGPHSGQRSRMPEARGDDFVRFVIELSVAHLDGLRDYCRTHAPEGVGVNVAPFSYDTQYRPNLPWHFVNAQGDVQNFGMYFWDMTSRLTKTPSFYVMDSHTVADKPTVIYETNHGRPGPFRTEFPFSLAAFAGWQDWDAIFFHYWGGPAEEDTPDEEYLLRRMLYPTTSHFWDAVHHDSDPAMCSAFAAAGQIFKYNMLRPAPDPVIREVGADMIYSYRHFGGVPGSGDEAFTRGSKVRFHSDRNTAPYERAERERPVKAVASGEEILWDWPNGRLILDTPALKVYVGKPDVYRFKDGITISGFNQPFVSFALVSADGRPLTGPDATGRAFVTAVFDAQNTDFAIDTTQNLSGPMNQAEAMRKHGRAPAQVSRVDYTLSFPQTLDYRFSGYDFALRLCHTQAVVSNVLRVRDQDLFMGLLQISGRRQAAEVVVDVLRSAPEPAVASDGADAPATDASLAAVPHPLPDVSWGDNVAQADKTLRESTLTHAGIEREGSAGTARRVIRLRDTNVFFDAPADVEVVFERERMVCVLATFTRPPVFEEAVAATEARRGAPSFKRIASQEVGSEVRWDKQPGGVRVQLAETQGVMTLRFERRP